MRLSNALGTKTDFSVGPQLPGNVLALKTETKTTQLHPRGLEETCVEEEGVQLFILPRCAEASLLCPEDSLKYFR